MMHILVSADFARQHEKAVREVVGADCKLVVADPVSGTPPSGLEEVEAAFLSLDLMGGRDETGAHPRLRFFSQVADQTPNLRWIHTQAAGADREVLQNAMRRGAVVTTSSGASSQAVAHTAIAGMLALARGVPRWVRAQEQKVWSTPTRDQWPRDINGSKALIIGTGPIGQAIARIAKAMDMDVTGVRRKAELLAGFDAMLTFPQMHEVLPQIDWVFLACPLTRETRGFVDAAFIEKLPEHARIVNVARGEVVSSKVVREALIDGRLAGYYSDVFEGEPLGSESEWWDTPRTLMSAHLAAASTGYGPRTVEYFLDNLRRYVSKQPLRNVVAPH